VTASQFDATYGQAPASVSTREPAGLDDSLDRFPAMAGKPRRFEVLAGGLTNRNYKVTTSAGRRAVARCSSDKSTLLAIDREAEYRNSVLAADNGVGPSVLGYAPGEGLLLVEWVDGHTFQPADLDDSQTLARVSRLCARLHGGPRFVSEFDMFDVQRRYLDIVEDRGFRLPDGYRELLPQVEQVRTALLAQPEATVPCHNDLLAANIIGDDERIWFIDYEYAGNNDPYFELGNLWAEAELEPARLEELVAAYVGRESRPKVARARLFAVLAQYGWTLWASIQDAVSDVAFDFWSWGMQKYERAVAAFRSQQFAQLIVEVQQADQP
jgi:thiamine kinase-like enzyme